MKNIQYWAGGFGNKNKTQNQNEKKLKEFIDGEFWQAMYYDINDKSNIAIKARAIFSEIAIGDKFLIKGLGGNYDLNVHFIGEVTGKGNEHYKLYLKRENVQLYHGKAPRGQGAGNWFQTLLEVKRQKDIDKLYNSALIKKQ